MAVKTFTTGEVLTAADTNTYLANAGLVYITSTTVGTAVSSVTVSNVFSSTYDNYLITLSGGTQSANNAVYLQLGSSTTGYYGILNYATVGTATPLATYVQNAAQMNWVGGGSANQACHVSVEIVSPYLAQYTKIRNGQYQNGDNYGTVNGEHRVATSYTAFTLAFDSGTTFTGGTVRVYGYRKA